MKSTVYRHGVMTLGKITIIFVSMSKSFWIKPFKTIPISCFTATAKPSVIEDIEKFFLEVFLGKIRSLLSHSLSEKNLKYQSIPIGMKDKYNELLRLINENEIRT